MSSRGLVVGALMMLSLLGCASGEAVAVGIVIDVRSASITDVEAFTMRDDAGRILEFQVGRLETGPNLFPANHLREHMALAQKVAVRYRDQGGVRVAYRLGDAP